MQEIWIDTIMLEIGDRHNNAGNRDRHNNAGNRDRHNNAGNRDTG